MKEFLINAGPLVAAIKTLKPFISDDDNRPYLGGIYFELGEESHTLNMVATDGIKMCILNAEVDRQELFSFGELQAIVPEKALDTILAMLKGINADCPIALTFGDGHSLHIDTPDEKGDFKCIDGAFPDYRKIIPTKIPKFIIGLGKAQAQEAMKAIATQGKEGLQWEMVDAHAPLVVRGENKLVIVMPMRVTLPGEITAAPETPQPKQTDLEQ